MPASRDYRRWAFESAALDLALRQAGSTLGEVVGREPAPLRFVVSTREDVRDWLAVAPGLEFKVDPIPGEWDEAHMDALAATGRVRVCDLKALYHGTPVDTAPDADFHVLIAERFPDAVLEDVSLEPDVLARSPVHLDRISFDAPIHSLADVDALPMRDQAPQHQAVALRAALASLRMHRRLPGARHRAVRRRPVRARRRPRPDSGDREPLLPAHAQRRRSAGLQRARRRSPDCRRARSRRRRGAPGSAGDRARAGGRRARRRPAAAGDRAEAHPVRAAAPRRDGGVLEAPLRHGGVAPDRIPR